jgi:histidyl-tRNA synthetase
MELPFRAHQGMVDILPDTAHAWQWLENIVRDTARTFGFEEIRTPVLEPTGLIARGIGQLTDIVSKEMFAFQRGEDLYVLRPEGTAPVARAFIEHRLEQRGGVQKLFYIGPMFRAERPQKGRQRQFHQFGAEVLGSAHPLADVESILFLMDVVRKTGLQNTVLNINSVGDPESRKAYKDALIAYFTPVASQLSEISQKRLETNPMRILDSKEPGDQPLIEKAPLISDYLNDDCRNHFDRVKKLLDLHNIGYKVNPRLVRGLDYYSKTAFELTSTSVGSQDALGGGGRYDYLIEELGGQPTPAVGMAAGMERILIACEAQGLIPKKEQKIDVYFVTNGEQSEVYASKMAAEFRSSGLLVAYDLSQRSFKAQMKEANRFGAAFAIFLGHEEVNAINFEGNEIRGQIKVRNLLKSVETWIPGSAINQFLICLRRFQQNQSRGDFDLNEVNKKGTSSKHSVNEAYERAIRNGYFDSDSHYKRIVEILNTPFITNCDIQKINHMKGRYNFIKAFVEEGRLIKSKFQANS